MPARIRIGATWGDACILNVSSRGLLIRSSRTAPSGSIVELRRGDHVIVARIVWREGAKAGLQAEELLPVDEILTLAQSASLQLTAPRSTRERRKAPRERADESRLKGRAIEFAGTVAIALSLGAGAVAIVGQAFARPLWMVKSALGG